MPPADMLWGDRYCHERQKKWMAELAAKKPA
jgi:hypothetical protein